MANSRSCNGPTECSYSQPRSVSKRAADASGLVQQLADTAGRSIDDISTIQTTRCNSERSKAPRMHVLSKAHIVVGDLVVVVYIYGDRNKSRTYDSYLVVYVDGVWYSIRKVVG